MLKRIWQWLKWIRPAYQFSCSCGDGIVGRVPRRVGDVLLLDCKTCGTGWDLTWTGNGFRTRMVNPMAANNATSAAEVFYMAQLQNVGMRPQLGEQAIPSEFGQHDLG